MNPPSHPPTQPTFSPVLFSILDPEQVSQGAFRRTIVCSLPYGLIFRFRLARFACRS